MHPRISLIQLALLLAAAPCALNTNAAENSKNTKESITRSLPANCRPTAADALSLPNYPDTEVIRLRVRDRFAYLLKPTAKVDPQKRWAWIFPFEHGINDAKGSVQHRLYAEKLLASGFHVAGISVGVSCGSPAAAEVCHEFYEMLIAKYGLNKRARLIGQSNGGLIAYAWAFRHPECVERIAGIYPVTDMRTWPGLDKVVVFPPPGLGFGLSLAELSARVPEFNPVDHLAPLAEAKVKLLHIHGDKDTLVPMEANSSEVMRRYKKLGGSAELVVAPGLGHGGAAFFESPRFVAFLLAD